MDLSHTKSAFPSIQIRDLISNSKYLICVEFHVTDIAGLDLDFEGRREQCLTLATIPVVRYQDLLILACVVGYLLLMCLIGLLCWMRARASFNRRYQSQLDSEQAREGEDSRSEASSYIRSSTGARIPDYPEKPSVHPEHALTAYSVGQEAADHKDIPYIDDERRETRRLL